MNKGFAITAAVVAVVAAAFVLDWWVIGAGPVTAVAKSRCVHAEEDKSEQVFPADGIVRLGSKPKFERVGHSAAKRRCNSAARDGKLTLRGGIK